MKVNCDCFGFTLLRLVIGLKISHHFLSQSELQPKPIMTRLRTFSRALCQLHVFALSFDWFTGLSVSFVIGQSNYFGFGFMTLNQKNALMQIRIYNSCGKCRLLLNHYLICRATLLPTGGGASVA